MDDPFVFSSPFDTFAPTNKDVETKESVKKDEIPLTKDGIEVDLDYIIIMKPKPEVVIKFLKSVASKLNEQYFDDR